MNFYICIGAQVKDGNGFEGKVISVDRKNRIAIVREAQCYRTKKFSELNVISYGKEEK